MGTFLTRWKGDIIKEVQHLCVGYICALATAKLNCASVTKNFAVESNARLFRIGTSRWSRRHVDSDCQCSIAIHHTVSLRSVASHEIPSELRQCLCLL